MNDSKQMAVELNAIIQKYLYEKLGYNTPFTVQYNEDHISLWVSLGDDEQNETSN